MPEIEEELRAWLREIGLDAPSTRGARAADDAIALTHHRRRAVVAGVVVGAFVLGAPAVAAVAAHPSDDGGGTASPVAGRSATVAGRSTPTTAGDPAVGSTAAPGPALPSNWQGPADPAVAVDYPFDLYTHCGIDTVTFGGRQWRADAPQAEPSRLPDANGVTSYTGYTAGVMRLIDDQHLRFTVVDPLSSADGRTVVFTVQPTAAQPLPLCE
jgi:hypothetical protein